MMPAPLFCTSFNWRALAFAASALAASAAFRAFNCSVVRSAPESVVPPPPPPAVPPAPPAPDGLTPISLPSGLPGAPMRRAFLRGLRRRYQFPALVGLQAEIDPQPLDQIVKLVLIHRHLEAQEIDL